jgi:hypothetical protein
MVCRLYGKKVARTSRVYEIGSTIIFDTYKPQPEMFWLKAECQGSR